MMSCGECPYYYQSPPCMECENYKGLKGEELKKHDEKIKREKERRNMRKRGGLVGESENDRLDLRCVRLDAEWDGYGRA